jgi:hypothetical protein
MPSLRSARPAFQRAQTPSGVARSPVADGSATTVPGPAPPVGIAVAPAAPAPGTPPGPAPGNDPPGPPGKPMPPGKVELAPAAPAPGAPCPGPGPPAGGTEPGAPAAFALMVPSGAARPPLGITIDMGTTNEGLLSVLVAIEPKPAAAACGFVPAAWLLSPQAPSNELTATRDHRLFFMNPRPRVRGAVRARIVNVA